MPIYLSKYIDLQWPFRRIRGGQGIDMAILRAKCLTTFSVAPDGASIALGVADEEGKEGALILPTDCLRELMMTLPEMMRRAPRHQYDDPSLRLVYRTAGWEIERSKVPGTFIVTLHTPDGFHVSFALTAADLFDMAGATREPLREASPDPPRRRSVH